MEKHQPVYTIGVAAELCGVSTHTIRYYESEGLIIPHRTSTDRRLYSNLDISRLQLIKGMISEGGLNISGIKAILALVPCWELKPCSKADRKQCEAYNLETGPCWTVKTKGPECRKVECRQCEVYKSLAECESIKAVLKGDKECLKHFTKISQQGKNKVGKIDR